ncbi:hypothetical protein ACLBSL_32570, partial [Klebsiella pneumoniae]|uniref:hypothetical protein n=1 Tax=Klebsiella pneumoniae TaxID=573 RepID=UPI003968FEE2
QTSSLDGVAATRPVFFQVGEPRPDSPGSHLHVIGQKLLIADHRATSRVDVLGKEGVQTGSA